MGKVWSREILSFVVVAAAVIQNEYCGQMTELLGGVDTTCPGSCAWGPLRPVWTDPDSVWNLGISNRAETVRGALLHPGHIADTQDTYSGSPAAGTGHL